MTSLIKNHTWDLIEKPEDARVVGSKWIFTVKSGIPGVEAKTQGKVGGSGVFSDRGDYELEQMDVKTAFLHGDLEERILMKQPEGFIKKGDENKSEYDQCVYMRNIQNENAVYLLLYVDDMLIASGSLSEIRLVKDSLSSKFEMKDMDATTTTTPLATHFKLKSLTKAEKLEEAVHMENTPYASAVGSLMYAMIGSRPDLAYAVGVISRFMSNPGRGHWTAVKWVLRYLRELPVKREGAEGFFSSRWSICEEKIRGKSVLVHQSGFSGFSSDQRKVFARKGFWVSSCGYLGFLSRGGLDPSCSSGSAKKVKKSEKDV
ncbi:unnamed protein product [Microthlaspi erraticum]|uniref:Reverse transcriptase Ty1/copia-type domain-containing protein n=1 Tax=Microthlaspi erraticum TaxID=1685480 RepID=A0A6D2LEF3_9BRAS|nr:unnamed protein product [Microthlaspi erraticum]